MSELKKTLTGLRARNATRAMNLEQGLRRYVGESNIHVLKDMVIPEIRSGDIQNIMVPAGMTMLDAFAGNGEEAAVKAFRDEVSKGGKKFKVGDQEVNFSKACDYLHDIRKKLETANEAAQLAEKVSSLAGESMEEKPTMLAPTAKTMTAFRYVPKDTSDSLVIGGFDMRQMLHEAQQLRNTKTELLRKSFATTGGRSMEDKTDDMEAEQVLFHLCTNGAVGMEKKQLDHARHFFADHPSKLKNFQVDPSCIEDYKSFVQSVGHANVGAAHLQYAVGKIHPFRKYAGNCLMRALTFGMTGMTSEARLAAGAQLALEGPEMLKKWMPHMTTQAKADAFQLIKIAHGASFMSEFDKQLKNQVHALGGDDYDRVDFNEWEEQDPTLMDGEDSEEKQEFIRESETDVVDTPDPTPAQIRDKKIDASTVTVIKADKKLHEAEFELEEVENQLKQLEKDHDVASDAYDKAKKDLVDLESRSSSFERSALEARRADLQKKEADARKRLDDITAKAYAKKAELDKLEKETDKWWDVISTNTGKLKHQSEQFFKRTFLSSKTMLPKTVEMADAMVNFMQFYFSFGKDYYESLREVMIGQGQTPLDASIYVIKSIPELRMFIEGLVEFNRRAPWPNMAGGYTYQPPFLPTANNEYRYAKLYQQSQVLRLFLHDAISSGDVKKAIQNVYVSDGVGDTEKLRAFRSFLDWLGDEIKCSEKGLSINAKKGIQAKRNQTFCRVSGGEVAAMKNFEVKYGGESAIATLLNRAIMDVDEAGRNLLYFVPRLDIGYHATDRMRGDEHYQRVYDVHYNALQDELWREYTKARPSMGDVHGMSDARFADWSRMNEYLLRNNVMRGYPKRILLLQKDNRAIRKQFSESQGIMYNDALMRRVNMPAIDPEELTWASVAASQQNGGALKTNETIGHLPAREFYVQRADGGVEMHKLAVGEEEFGEVKAMDGGHFRNLTQASAMACARDEDYHAMGAGSFGAADDMNGMFLRVGSRYMPQKLEELMSDLNRKTKEIFNPITDHYKYPEPYPGKTLPKKQRKPGFLNAIVNGVVECEEATKKLVVDAPFDALTADTMTGMVKEGLKTAKSAIAEKVAAPVHVGEDIIDTIKIDIETKNKAKPETETHVGEEDRGIANEVMYLLGLGWGEEDTTIITGDWDYDTFEFELPPGNDFIQRNFESAINPDNVFMTARDVIETVIASRGFTKSDVMIALPSDRAMRESGITSAIANNPDRLEFFAFAHIFPKVLENGEVLVSLAGTTVSKMDLLLGTADTNNASWLIDETIDSANLLMQDSIELKIVLPQALMMFLVEEGKEPDDALLEKWVKYKNITVSKEAAKKFYGE